MAATVCVISGIPIDYNCDVVAIKVEHYRWAKERPMKYVPASFPYFGTYDYDNCCLSGDESIDVWNSFFVHRQVWDNAEMYFHELNNNKPLVIDTKLIHKIIKEEHNYAELIPDRPKFSDVTYAYGALERQLTNNYSHSDFNICLKHLFDSAGDLNNIANVPKDWCFLEYNRFAEIICEKIVKEEWKDEDNITLMKIISLFNATMVLGKILQPAGDIRVEQCVGYKQRKKLNSLQGKILKSVEQKYKKFYA
jgi:hypothetical protein